jgi:hypothetical protein
MQDKTAYIRPTVVRPFPGPCTSGSYVHRAALFLHYFYRLSSNLAFETSAGLFNMLSDSSHEIRQQADAALSEFLQEIKNSPVRLSSKYLYQPMNCTNITDPNYILLSNNS